MGTTGPEDEDWVGKLDPTLRPELGHLSRGSKSATALLARRSLLTMSLAILGSILVGRGWGGTLGLLTFMAIFGGGGWWTLRHYSHEMGIVKQQEQEARFYLWVMRVGWAIVLVVCLLSFLSSLA